MTTPTDPRETDDADPDKPRVRLNGRGYVRVRCPSYDRNGNVARGSAWAMKRPTILDGGEILEAEE